MSHKWTEKKFQHWKKSNLLFFQLLCEFLWWNYLFLFNKNYVQILLCLKCFAFVLFFNLCFLFVYKVHFVSLYTRHYRWLLYCFFFFFIESFLCAAGVCVHIPHVLVICHSLTFNLLWLIVLLLAILIGHLNLNNIGFFSGHKFKNAYLIKQFASF